MKLSAPVSEARSSGRLGLVLYAIPGFPSRQGYEEQLEFLERVPEVSLIELAIPVRRGFSEHANDVIREAHLGALGDRDDGLALYASLPRPRKPALLVLYEDVLRETSYEALLERHGSRFDGVVLEWDTPDPTPYLPAAKQYGVEIVQCIGPWMEAARVETIVDASIPGGLVYLMSAAMTGAALFEADALSRCIDQARRVRDDLTYAAGFGIRTGADVRRLKNVSSLDAVIVGTAYLEASARGMPAVEKLVRELVEAL
jgi:tryptophan synthase alpha subunit